MGNKFSSLLEMLDWNKRVNRHRIIFVILCVIVLIVIIITVRSCSSNDITEPDTVDVPQQNEEPVQEDVYFVTAYQNSGINVRKEPSRNSGKVLYIDPGDTSIKLKYSGESKFVEDYVWYNVLLPDGGNGWVREDIVVEDKIND